MPEFCSSEIVGLDFCHKLEFVTLAPSQKVLRKHITSLSPSFFSAVFKEFTRQRCQPVHLRQRHQRLRLQQRRQRRWKRVERLQLLPVEQILQTRDRGNVRTTFLVRFKIFECSWLPCDYFDLQEAIFFIRDKYRRLLTISLRLMEPHSTFFDEPDTLLLFQIRHKDPGSPVFPALG